MLLFVPVPRFPCLKANDDSTDLGLFPVVLLLCCISLLDTSFLAELDSEVPESNPIHATKSLIRCNSASYLNNRMVSSWASADTDFTISFNAFILPYSTKLGNYFQTSTMSTPDVYDTDRGENCVVCGSSVFDQPGATTLPGRPTCMVCSQQPIGTVGILFPLYFVPTKLTSDL